MIGDRSGAASRWGGWRGEVGWSCPRKKYLQPALRPNSIGPSANAWALDRRSPNETIVRTGRHSQICRNRRLQQVIHSNQEASRFYVAYGMPRMPKTP